MKNPSKHRQSFITVRSFQLLDSAGEQYDMTFSDLREPGEEIPAKGATHRVTSRFAIPDGSPGPLRFRAQRSPKSSVAYWEAKPPTPQ